MATRDDLIDRALFVLGLKQAGQPAGAEDAAVIRASIPGKLAELRRRKIITIANVQAFDDAYLEWLGILVANGVPQGFGLPIDPGAVLLAESRLKEMQPTDDADEPIRSVYY